MHTFPIQSFEYYFPDLKNNFRIRKAFNFFISLPHANRKYEKCSSALHSIRVAQEIVKSQKNSVHTDTTESEIIIALFHDILEDFSFLSAGQLEKYCTTSEIQEIIILTKPVHCSYSEYMKKIQTSHTAQKIKKLDMRDNLKTANTIQKRKYAKYTDL